MSSVDRLLLTGSPGQWLSSVDYAPDFAQNRSAVRGKDSWKFERRQHFAEDTPGRNAFGRGDWKAAMKILEERRESLFRSAREDRENNTTFYRVRVVEEPLSPYLQWELRSLRVQAECGKPTRVVGTEAISGFESGALLPEVVILGGQTLYEVVYDASGVPQGAFRHADADVLKNWEEFIEELYRTGEDIILYCDRQLAEFPPPQT